MKNTSFPYNLIAYAMCMCVTLLCLTGSASAFVLGPTHWPQYGSPGKWGQLGDGTSGGIVTWSLMSTGVQKSGTETFTALGDFMSFDYRSLINASFSAWSAVADIQFVEVADAGEAFGVLTPNSADIRIGGHDFDGAGGELAHAYFPPGWGGVAGDIHFDTSETWKDQDGGAGFNFQRVLMHEIGHAIGLDHENSIASIMDPYYNESIPLGLTADDIAGAQYLYGAAAGDPATSNSTLPYGNMTNAAVPEPATVMLLGVGVLIMMAGYGWRRKKQVSVI